MGVLPACMTVHHVHAVPTGVRGPCQISWDSPVPIVSHPVGAGEKSGASGRAAIAFNLEPTLQPSSIFLFNAVYMIP